MTPDTEKALLDARVALCRIESALRVAADSIGREADALNLASLEPKPRDFTCGDCGGKTWRDFSPHLPERVCRDCGWREGEPKPEPKRGVGEVERLLDCIAGCSACGHCNHDGRLALRLYREERERVEKVVEDMNAEASEGIWAAADWRGHVMEWADELERRGAD